MNNLSDLRSTCVSADSLADFSEYFDEGFDYVKLCDVEELLNNIETEVSFTFDEINRVIKRFD